MVVEDTHPAASLPPIRLLNSYPIETAAVRITWYIEESSSGIPWGHSAGVALRVRSMLFYTSESSSEEMSLEFRKKIMTATLLACTGRVELRLCTVCCVVLRVQGGDHARGIDRLRVPREQKCSSDTFPESYITKYTSKRREPRRFARLDLMWKHL